MTQRAAAVIRAMQPYEMRAAARLAVAQAIEAGLLARPDTLRRIAFNELTGRWSRELLVKFMATPQVRPIAFRRSA